MKALRRLGWVMFATGAVIALVLWLLQLFTVTHTWHTVFIVAATFIPLLWTPAMVAALGLTIALRGRRRLIGAALLVAAIAYWSQPWWPRPQVIHDAVPVTIGISVLAINTEYGRADLAGIEAEVSEQIQVLVLLENTPDFERRFAESSLAEQFPHRVGTARTDAGGTVIYGRHPLTEVERLDTAFDQIVVSTTVQDVEWLVAAIHTAPPQLGAPRWAADGRAVADLVSRYRDERLMLVGDFNAIDQHHTMRQIVASGARNPAIRGSLQDRSWDPTWPMDGPVPPFARIDHYLYTRAVQGWYPRYFAVEGTDHKGLIASAPLPNR